VERSTEFGQLSASASSGPSSKLPPDARVALGVDGVASKASATIAGVLGESGTLVVYIAIDDDAQRARRRIGETLQRFYPFFQVSQLEAFPVYGPADGCVRGLRDVAEAGAELILLNPVFDEAEQMERLVAEVVPKLT
jgi:hypothetical protein